jgi:hypothetical protein
MQNILVAPLSGVVDAFLERALEVRYRFGATAEPHARAEVISTSLTRPTVVTRHAHLECYALANLEPSDCISNGGDHSRRLVAQRERLHGLEIAVAEVLVVGNVATADTGDFDSDLEFMGPWV